MNFGLISAEILSYNVMVTHTRKNIDHLGRVVSHKNKSSVLSSLVGSVTICVSPWSQVITNRELCTEIQSMVIICLSMPGVLKSPVS